MAPALPDLMTPVEAAAVLRAAPGTLANWRSARIGPPFIKISSGAIRYSRSAVAMWLLAQEHNPTAGARV